MLRGVDLALAPGERVALMGRNGAGKSTLLRLAAGLAEPTRGRIVRAGRVSLLLQNPGDYLVAERVGEELPAAALEAAGLGALADRHPRDLSGGERQRLALEVVTAWSAETTEAAMRAFADSNNLKLGAIAQPLRVALTGRTASPGIFDVLAVLGRRECLDRLSDQAPS